MSDAGRSGTIVHYVTNVGGGVWSVVKALAAHHRPRWRMLLVGVHRGPLGPGVEADAQRLFDRPIFAYRPPIPAIHYLAPLRVAAALRALRIDDEAGPIIHHFHAGPCTPWVYRLPWRPRPGKWLASFHGSRGSFGERPGTLGGAEAAAVRRGRGRNAAERLHLDLRKRTQRTRLCRDVPLPRRRLSHRVQRHGARRHGVSGCPRPRAAIASRLRGHGHAGQGLAQSRRRRGIAPPRRRERRVLDRGQRPGVCRPATAGCATSGMAYCARSGRAARAARLAVAGRARAAVRVRRSSDGSARSHGRRSDLHLRNVGGCAETVRHGQEGFILHENTAAEIAAHLNRIIVEDGLWVRLSRNSVVRHAAMFTAARMAASWEQLYRESDGGSERWAEGGEPVDRQHSNDDEGASHRLNSGEIRSRAPNHDLSAAAIGSSARES